ncbi:MAG: C40 family peptidase [Armatimonadaceae bacterium]
MNRQISWIALAVALLPSASAFAQGDGSLEIPVNTGNPIVAAPPPMPSPKQPASPKPSRQTTRGTVRGLPPLPSRIGAVSRTVDTRPVGEPAPRKVLARVGAVVLERVEIRATMGPTSSVLSVVLRDVHLAVLKESDTHYGVLMANTTLGWVPKEAVSLIDYNTEVEVPKDEPTEPQWSPDQSSLTEREQTILREAFTYLGVPYVWAGNTRKGLDCSAFVKNVFKTVGDELPRHSGDQARVGDAVIDSLRPGDRLYFAMKGSRVSHCGIYIGNQYFIHASSNQKQVGVDRIYEGSHYGSKLVAVRR